MSTVEANEGSADPYIRMQLTADPSLQVFPPTAYQEDAAVLRAARGSISQSVPALGTNLVVVVYPHNPRCPMVSGWFEVIGGKEVFIPDQYTQLVNAPPSARCLDTVAFVARGGPTTADLDTSGQGDVAHFPAPLNVFFQNMADVVGMKGAASRASAQTRDMWVRSTPCAPPSRVRGTGQSGAATRGRLGDADITWQRSFAPTSGNGTGAVVYDLLWDGSTSLGAEPVGPGSVVTYKGTANLAAPDTCAVTLQLLTRGTGGALISLTDPGFNTSTTSDYGVSDSVNIDLDLVVQTSRPVIGVRVTLTSPSNITHRNNQVIIARAYIDSALHRGAVVMVWRGLKPGLGTASMSYDSVVRCDLDNDSLRSDGTAPQPVAPWDAVYRYNVLLDRGLARPFGFAGDDDEYSPSRAPALTDRRTREHANMAWYTGLGRGLGAAARGARSVFRAARGADRALGGAIGALVPPVVRDGYNALASQGSVRGAYDRMAQLAPADPRPRAECAVVQRWLCPIGQAPLPIDPAAIVTFRGHVYIAYALDAHPPAGLEAPMSDTSPVAAFAEMADLESLRADLRLNRASGAADYSALLIPAAITAGQEKSGAAFLAVASAEPIDGVRYVAHSGCAFDARLWDAAQEACAAVALHSAPPLRHFAVITTGDFDLSGGSFSLGLLAANWRLAKRAVYSGLVREDGAIGMVGSGPMKLRVAAALRLPLIGNLDVQTGYRRVTSLAELRNAAAIRGNPPPAPPAPGPILPPVPAPRQLARPPRPGNGVGTPRPAAGPRGANALTLGEGLELIRAFRELGLLGPK